MNKRLDIHNSKLEKNFDCSQITIYMHGIEPNKAFFRSRNIIFKGFVAGVAYYNIANGMARG